MAQEFCQQNKFGSQTILIRICKFLKILLKILTDLFTANVNAESKRIYGGQQTENRHLFGVCVEGAALIGKKKLKTREVDYSCTKIF